MHTYQDNYDNKQTVESPSSDHLRYFEEASMLEVRRVDAIHSILIFYGYQQQHPRK